MKTQVTWSGRENAVARALARWRYMSVNEARRLPFTRSFFVLSYQYCILHQTLSMLVTPHQSCELEHEVFAKRVRHQLTTIPSFVSKKLGREVFPCILIISLPVAGVQLTTIHKCVQQGPSIQEPFRNPPYFFSDRLCANDISLSRYPSSPTRLGNE